MNKYIIIALLFIAYFLGMTWVFNHVNPWLSIILTIVGIIGLLNYIINQTKKHTK